MTDKDGNHSMKSNIESNHMSIHCGGHPTHNCIRYTAFNGFFNLSPNKGTIFDTVPPLYITFVEAIKLWMMSTMPSQMSHGYSFGALDFVCGRDH